MREKNENTEWLFGGDDEHTAWEAHRRFISEVFNPIYRQGVIGQHHLPEADFALFLSTAQSDPILAAQQLRTWIGRPRPQGGDFGDLAMDRISARAFGFDAETALGITEVFAEIMDDYYRVRPKFQMFIDVWQQSESIIRSFRASVSDFHLDPLAEQIAQARALAWVICTIAQRELRFHGLAGGVESSPENQLLSKEVLRKFLTTLIDRVHKLTIDELLELPHIIRILFTLKDSPWNGRKVSTILGKFVGPGAPDAIFLRFLQAASGIVVSSSHGAFRTLSIPSLQLLFGEAAFDRRWSDINNKLLSPELAAQLDQVNALVDEAKNW